MPRDINAEFAALLQKNTSDGSQVSTVADDLRRAHEHLVDASKQAPDNVEIKRLLNLSAEVQKNFQLVGEPAIELGQPSDMSTHEDLGSGPQIPPTQANFSVGAIPPGPGTNAGSASGRSQARP